MILLRALGNCVIETSKALLTPNHEILFAAALYIVLNRHRKVTRDALEAALWPDADGSEHAHHRLRQTILKLKQAGFPVLRDQGFLLCGLPIETDFEKLLAMPKENDLPALPDSFELLPDYAPRLTISYSHWLDEKRREINGALIRNLLEHIRYARNRGEWARVESLTRTCREIDPYNEEAVLARAESVALRGGKLEALALLDEYVSELGEAPSEIRIPANVMRRRISERCEQPAYDARANPLLGRANELAVLNSALEMAEYGAGQCCVIEGDLGMGKSRLVSEFADFAQLKGVEVRYTRAQPSDHHRPLSAFIDLVPALRKLRGAIGCTPESLECLNRLTHNSPRESFATKLYDPAAIAENNLAAILDLLDAVSEEKSIALIIDDAHWLDQASSALFEAISHWVEARKVMIVFSVRSPVLEWSLFENLARVKLVKISSLQVDDAKELVAVLLKQRGKTASAKAIGRFVEVGEGNPFFLSELVGQWAESGRQNETPPSLIAITNQRLNKLSGVAKQILQTCAVLGRFATLARLEEILEFKTFELLGGLNELGKCSMIRAEKLPGENSSEPRVVCAHELIGAAAVKLLSPPAELAMHRRIGLILERETVDEYSPSIIGESALHWEKAGDTKHALRLTTSYAEHLMGIGFPNDAIQSYRKAIGFCASPAQKIEVLTPLIAALHAAGAWKEVTESVLELNRLKTVGGDTPCEHSHIELIDFEAKWRSSNDWSDLLKNVKKCIFAKDAPPGHRVRAAVLGLKLATNVGTGEELDQIYSAVEEFLENPAIDNEARLYVKMVYHIDRGDMEFGKDAAHRLVENERTAGNPANLIWSLVNAAQAMRRCGLFASSVHYLEEAFDLARKKNLQTRARTVAHHLILTSIAQDDLIGAKEWLAIAREYPSPSEDHHTRDELFYYGARIALKEGNLKESIQLCDQIPVSKDQSLLRRISLLALNLRQAVHSRTATEIVAQLLSQLVPLYEVECARGGQDFEAMSLYLGRQYIGESDIAVRQLNDYVTVFRRERGPPPHEIIDALLAHAKRGA